MNRTFSVLWLGLLALLTTACTRVQPEVDEERQVATASAAVVAAGHCDYGTLPTNTTWVQPGYTFRYRKWLLKGNGLTRSDEWIALEWDVPTTISITWNCLRAFLQAPAGGALQYVWTSGATLVPGTARTYRATLKLPTSALAAGSYNLLLVANEQTVTFERLPINISSPLYVVMSVDWDFPLTPPSPYGDMASLLARMDGYRADQPDFVYSHFAGAYLWGDPYSIPDASQQAPRPPALVGQVPDPLNQLETWFKSRPQDELGVHIHTWEKSLLNNVPRPACCSTSCSDGTGCAAAQPVPPACCATATCIPGTACPLPPHVERRAVPSWDPPGTSDPSGYSALISGYSASEILTMLDYSSRVLVSRGFKQPLSFRAGGWSGSNLVLDQLRLSHTYGLDASGQVTQLPGQGYFVDSSSVPYDDVGSVPALRASLIAPPSLSATYDSNVGPKAQPYWGAGGTVLEVPDNGCLADYRSPTEAPADLWKNNADSATAVPLPTPRVYQFGFHPHTVASKDDRVKALIAAVRTISYAVDNGPAVYARISDLRRVGTWAATGP